MCMGGDTHICAKIIGGWQSDIGWYHVNSEIYIYNWNIKYKISWDVPGVFTTVLLLFCNCNSPFFFTKLKAWSIFYNNYQISGIFDNYKTELPDIILVGKIRICDGWHGGQNENRVKYGFVTVRDLLLVRAIRGVRGIRKLPWPKTWCILKHIYILTIAKF
jgi:hypothetical protein